MFEMKPIVMVDFGDFAHFLQAKKDISWNAVHDIVFGQYDDPLVYAQHIERKYMGEFIEDKVLLQYLVDFMDYHELEEFYWVAK